MATHAADTRAPPAVEIRIAQDADVLAARVAGRSFARALGFQTIQVHCITTSISELAANILVHAGSGGIALAAITRADGEQGLEVVASDQGSGIENIELAMQDGFSTSEGLGCGLSGANRLMSELHISSSVDDGTVVRAIKWLDDRSSP